MNNLWGLLGIEPTNDVRAIKKAYAIQLKSTRPDEDTNAFQMLHQAYKKALALVESAAMHEARPRVHSEIEGQDGSQRQLDVPRDDQAASEQGNIEAADLQSESPSAVNENIERQQQALRARQEVFMALTAKVAELLESKRLADTVEPWRFLESTPYVLEDDFNWALGCQVFKMFVEFSKVRLKHRKSGGYYNRKIPDAVLGYCNQIFFWNTRRDYLEQNFGGVFCRDLCYQIESAASPEIGLKVRGGVINYEKSSTLSTLHQQRAERIREKSRHELLVFLAIFTGFVLYVVTRLTGIH
ncbi:J domain-containing protein [Cellvibrio polysaccharolyticus]|uniref:J domain-containing protein n=1 Tax=Cellvibrio polysaccharolyticus TaxID=2082724 RepID=A0A928YVI5_9GAMM|nr:hypothetical protein [Cellvibrio polysaccharolyticus]MBE8718590.1 hypothetical protein [Cellvibrio polysaccharolyticus]